jgi:hemerythrin
MSSGFQVSVAVYTGPSFLDPNQTGEVHVGIPEIDSEHRQLVVQYNALLQALDEGDDVTAFGLSFYTLILLLREHFYSEERMMQDLDYPGLAQHKAEHEKLLATVDDFLRSVMTRFEKYDCSAVTKYFKYWLFDHVMRHDRSFANFAMDLARSSWTSVHSSWGAADIA